MTHTRIPTPKMDNHARRIIEHIKQHGPHTITALAHDLGIPRRSVANIMSREPWRELFRVVDRAGHGAERIWREQGMPAAPAPTELVTA
jgi:hypothetical protein